MLNLSLEDFIIENYSKIDVSEKIWVGKFKINPAYKKSSLAKVSELFNHVKQPYEYNDALSFMLGVTKSLIISDGYETYKLALK